MQATNAIAKPKLFQYEYSRIRDVSILYDIWKYWVTFMNPLKSSSVSIRVNLIKYLNTSL